MNPDPNFDRVRTALYCGQPDRVPLAEVTIDEEAKEAFLGKPLNDLATDLEFFIEAGYDYVSLGRRMAGFPGVWDAARSDNYYEAQRPVGKGAMKGVIYDWDDFRTYPWMKHGDLDFRITWARACGIFIGWPLVAAGASRRSTAKLPKRGIADYR